MTPHLETERLILRPWEERDRDIFYEINSDPQVMEFFPFRRDRQQSDAFFETLLLRQAERLTFPALELRETGECLGFCGLHDGDVEPAFPAGTVEVGWRLATRHWGKGYATEGACTALKHGFETLGLPEIVSFAVHDNNRSTSVMERIGLRREPARDFDHPHIPDTHAHLKRHVVYRITAEDWRTKKGGQPG
ncbi:MAG: GNAT family N-acetyltransferase [Ahrensia sp.]|nr:GNAT family N-acetyltransferase [Ahrensia sp.]